MFSSCYSEKKSEQMIITNLILFSRFFITIPYYICIRSFAYQEVKGVKGVKEVKGVKGVKTTVFLT